ncbi:bacterial sugar transferase family protein [Synechococcus sp. BOUM118]|nr:bacterial sugar transferase family protein [Synechococcus sp. BOUM118]
MNYKTFKTFCDIIVSFSLIILLSPLLLLLSIVILLSSPGPIIYLGTRAGLNNKPFKIFKFRSMVHNAESLGGFSTAIRDPRFTNVGRFIRRFKLDELPQLFNILTGDMSLVGPRPQVFYYTNKYIGEQKNILSVKPGITDISSIHFSDMDSVLGDVDVDRTYERDIEPKKNALRVKYISNISLSLDLLILICTLFSLFKINLHETLLHSYFEDI